MNYVGQAFDDHSPIYRQIAARIKADVLNGSLRPEEQITSTNQYAAFFRINPATVQKAFQELVDEGLIYKKRGIGMFIAADARERLLKEHRERFFTSVVEPMAIEARAIGVPLKQIIRRLEELDREDPR